MSGCLRLSFVLAGSLVGAHAQPGGSGSADRAKSRGRPRLVAKGSSASLSNLSDRVSLQDQCRQGAHPALLGGAPWKRGSEAFDRQDQLELALSIELAPRTAVGLAEAVRAAIRFLRQIELQRAGSGSERIGGKLTVAMDLY